MFIRAALAALFVISALSAAPPQAAAQIADEDRATALLDAFARLSAAVDEPAAKAAEAEVWALWFIGPDKTTTDELALGAGSIRAGRFDDAHRRLDALIAAAPGFAEAWNQRAFARFLKGDLYGSLTDIEETLKREPRHFGALAGRARIEARLGRPIDASKTMGEVGAIHPWLARRSAIKPDPAPGEPL
ncbi:MAG: hypothetical protein AAF360_12250 [Pseudomonadota bacterium]